MTRDEILAMEAGREMDALVAEEVMGWTYISPLYCGYPASGPIGPNEAVPYKWPARLGATQVPNYSTDIAAAWQVVEHLYSEKWIVGIGSLVQVPREWRCELCNMWEDDFSRCPSDIEANADTAPLVICRAALLATMEVES